MQDEGSEDVEVRARNGNRNLKKNSDEMESEDAVVEEEEEEEVDDDLFWLKLENNSEVK